MKNPNTPTMETTASNLHAFFSEIKKTIFCLGEKNFYRKLCQINEFANYSDNVDCQSLSQQIFLFLSKHNFKDCCLKLIELQNHNTKIPEDEYLSLLEFISIKFDVSKESILRGRTLNVSVQNARSLFFYLLKSHYNIPPKDIIKTHYFKSTSIDRYIRKHSELNIKIPEHKSLIEKRIETIQYLKTF